MAECICDYGTDRTTLTTCNRCEGTGRLPEDKHPPWCKCQRLCGGDQ